ncbi:hypothetical protein [Hyphomonas jannaschiana]|jgi:hypothetical protein|uniref:Lipoprotein n=1 Tax=Hyphomonas jannaschiana VP2 TaxID=1280952 RepID=A0A059FAK9_9PROT|nr:hypothetical protein [Hyphomonas jannaschiana]KCZ87637.1 hypothetical protein HJA_11574 [Hyphomonas jannaschiana VP2]
MRYSILILPALFLAAACASSPEPAPAENDAASQGVVKNTEAAAGSAYTQTKDGIPDAAMSPLEDLNLKRDPIPVVLQGIESPYDVPEDIGCSEITLMLAELDAALGPDWDTENPDERLRTEKLADEASDAALDTISSTASGLIPFRSLVRRATGAYAYQKKYNQAFRLGAQRRAYLKGVGLARNCPPPARPNPVEAEPDKTLFKGDTPD